MKKLAVLGGMGPMATIVFYTHLTKHTLASCDNDHMDILISSHASIPDRTDCILNGDDESIVKEAMKDIRIFEQYNADYMVFTCNTFHYYAETLKSMTDIELINMIDETLKKISLKDKKFVVFGTVGTRKGRVYEKYAKNYELEQFYTDDDEQKFLMDLIYNIKETNNDISFELNEMIRKYLNKDIVPILACTELSCVKLDSDIVDRVYDPLKILAKICIEKTGHKYF